MRTVRLALALLALTIGCGKDVGGDDDSAGDDDGTPPPPPTAWRLDVDMSGLDRFVPVGSTSWAIGGTVTATEGLAGVDVGGAAALLSGSDFEGTAVPQPGLTVVPILARDSAGHERQADRSLIMASFLPEGAANPDGAGLVLTDAILASMGDSLVGEAADIDVAGEILARDVLSQDDRCITWPVAAQQGEIAVALERDGATLWLNIRIPDLYVYFEGECEGLFSIIPIAGEMIGDIDLWTRLTPEAPGAGEECLHSFGHTTPEVYVNNWGFDVWGLGGPLQNWIIELFSGSKSAEARAQIADEMRTRSDELLDEKLADIAVFDRVSDLELLGRPVQMHLCLSALQPSGNQLVARVAASASGGGSREAPGAPMHEGAVIAAGPNELLLDGNVVGQLLYSAWRDGGLTRPSIQQVELSLIALLVPELQDAYPDATHVDVSIDGELPPVVRATPDVEGADLRVELGDLMLDLTIGADRIFRFGVHLTLDLDLVPTDGKLVPTVVAQDATVVLLDELYDGPDAALQSAVKVKIGDAAADLLGGAALSLPELPGLGAPANVTANEGGRYLHIGLQ
jgi:hypothetical protein